MKKVACARCGMTIAETAGNVIVIGRRDERAEIVGAVSVSRQCRNCGYVNEITGPCPGAPLDKIREA